MLNQIDFVSSDNIDENDENASITLMEDRDLWDGIFWFEAFAAVKRTTECFHLNTIVDSIREVAFLRAGIAVHHGHDPR